MGWEDEIRLRIKNLIKKYNTSDPAILCIYDDLGDLKGYYKHLQGRKVIVVNSLLSKFAQIIVLARELGHAILHSGSTVALMYRHILQYSNIMENEANKFAAELLLNGYDTDNIEYCDYYCDEVSNDENDRVLFRKIKIIQV